MCFKLKNLVYKIPSTHLHKAEYAVLWALCDYVQSENDFAFPKMKTLAEKAKLSESHLRHIIGELEDNQLIIVKRDERKNKPNKFLINGGLLRQMVDTGDYSIIADKKMRSKKTEKSVDKSVDNQWDNQEDNLCIGVWWTLPTSGQCTTMASGQDADGQRATPYISLNPQLNPKFIFNHQFVRAAETEAEKERINFYHHDEYTSKLVDIILNRVDPTKFSMSIMDMCNLAAVVDWFCQAFTSETLLWHFEQADGIFAQMTDGKQLVKAVKRFMQVEMEGEEDSKMDSFITNVLTRGVDKQMKAMQDRLDGKHTPMPPIPEKL